eukprot:Gb_27669 [translate_table: standard]
MAWLTRFVVMVSFLALGILVSLDAFGSNLGGQTEGSARVGGYLAVVLKLAHLLSFVTSWGAALWVTFIGGIIMFKSKFQFAFYPENNSFQSKSTPQFPTETALGDGGSTIIAVAFKSTPYNVKSSEEFRPFTRNSNGFEAPRVHAPSNLL